MVAEASTLYGKHVTASANQVIGKKRKKKKERKAMLNGGNKYFCSSTVPLSYFQYFLLVLYSITYKRQIY